MDYSKSTASCLCKRLETNTNESTIKNIHFKSNMVLMNFQAESKIKAKAKRAHRKEGDNDWKGQKAQAGQTQNLQKAVCLHGSLRKPHRRAGLPLGVEHLTLLWETWDSSTWRGKRWILEASRLAANRHLQKAKQGTAAPGNPPCKEIKGKLSCKEPEHTGIDALHFPYIWNNIVEPIKDHCNYFQKSDSEHWAHNNPLLWSKRQENASEHRRSKWLIRGCPRSVPEGRRNALILQFTAQISVKKLLREIQSGDITITHSCYIPKFFAERFEIQEWN